jgi:hypothetical protein
MAVSKEDDEAGDRAKAIWTFGLMTRFVRKLDGRRANRAAPLENVKTIITSSAYFDGGELCQCGGVALWQALAGRGMTGIWPQTGLPRAARLTCLSRLPATICWIELAPPVFRIGSATSQGPSERRAVGFLGVWS